MINNLKIGDIGFTYEKRSVISRLIYAVMIWKEKRPAYKLSHTLIYTGNGYIVEADFQGIVCNSLRKYDNDQYEIHFKRCVDLEDDQRTELLGYLNELLNVEKPTYSYMQLVLLFFKKLFNLKRVGDFSENQIICSELVFDAFMHVGSPLIVQYVEGMDGAELTPLDIYNAINLRNV
jgi:hypothetical protein